MVVVIVMVMILYYSSTRPPSLLQPLPQMQDPQQWPPQPPCGHKHPQFWSRDYIRPPVCVLLHYQPQSLLLLLFLYHHDGQEEDYHHHWHLVVAARRSSGCLMECYVCYSLWRCSASLRPWSLPTFSGNRVTVFVKIPWLETTVMSIMIPATQPCTLEPSFHAWQRFVSEACVLYIQGTSLSVRKTPPQAHQEKMSQQQQQQQQKDQNPKLIDNLYEWPPSP